MNPIINTTKKVVPMCYGYITPEIARHDGWTKIGYTERDVTERIKEQTHTADVETVEVWRGKAEFDDGSGETFTDKDFHAYLRKNDIEQEHGKNNEWFHVDGQTSKNMFRDFRENRGILETLDSVVEYSLRKEQDDAVTQAYDYFDAHKDQNPEFLWNAKPRFGKTLSTYNLVQTLEAEKVLIVTNRPAIANSWYQDYEKFLGTESGYYFVSNVDSIKNKKYVVSRQQYLDRSMHDPNCKGCIEFISLQDLKGSIHFGGQYDKLEEVAHLEWDILVIDEAHEGVDTYKTDVAFDHIHRKYTLHLSGTPFKALANDKFGSDAIYNWTYADEQAAKRDWDVSSEIENPYANLPKLNLLTYKMSDIVFDRASAGADFNDDGDNEAYCFDLNEFFKTNESGTFVHDADVDKFLDALVSQKKFPFSEDYRDELKHTLWMVGSDVPTRSAKALVKKLKAHPIFNQYEIVSAFGNNEVDEDDIYQMDKVEKDAYKAVTEAIKKHDKTITVSVGKLTTGVTIPEWTAVMMLSNMKSPSLYMQAAFRAQNPCLFKTENGMFRKENAYVFDFDPARTLDIFEQFANGLYKETASGKGDSDIRKKHVRELLNFFPVYGEDDDGEMIELDAEKVLSIPRAIHAKEVVRKGFMSNFLFQNISGIFSAPAIVTNIINKFEPVKEPAPVTKTTASDLNLNAEGDVDIPNSTVVGTASEVFGDKIYSDISTTISSELDTAVTTAQEEENSKPKDDTLDKIKAAMHVNITDELTSKAKENYGKDMSKSTQADVTREINKVADKAIEKHYGDFAIKKNQIEMERKNAVEQAEKEGRSEDVARINAEAKSKQQENSANFKNNLMTAVDDIIEDAGNTIVKAVETDKKEKEKKGIEDKVRDHLRGFSRTIPSFLMGYGDGDTTLENFDTIIPEEVFLEVTGITVEDFKFLRDGGDYPDPDNAGQMKHFDGKLFEPVVFNDSVKEFLKKRDMLADYFREDLKEDIFDYIPPQKTNQIYTPKKVVNQMVDYLEQENPNCFDNPDATFIDLYMKSGLYITEIVKRLYRSEAMGQKFPDDTKRLEHIFGHQVYGLAPTEIIYAISTHYILGFAQEKGMSITSDHFKMLDALPYAQAGILDKKLDELFDGGPEIKLDTEGTGD